MPPRPDVSAERRAQIVDAALACFSRKGYNNTTMDDIVAESGLSKGSLYWYFDSKDELFEAAVASFFEELGQEALASLDQYPTATGKLRGGALALADFCRKAQGLFALLLEFLAQSDRREEASRFWAGILVQYNKAIAEIVEEGIRNGEFRPVDAEELVWAILAAYDGLAAYVVLVPDLDLDRISQVFVETLLNGLQAE